MARKASPLTGFLLFIFTSLPLLAQTGLWVNESITPNTPVLRDIDMRTSMFGIAVGASEINATGASYSGVMITSNGGARWDGIESKVPRFKPELPEYTSWRGVHVIDEYNAIIVGDSAMAYRTTDAGQTWEEVTVNYGASKYMQRPTMHAVYMADGQNGVMVGGDNLDAARSGGEWHPPMLFTTSDGGVTWNDASPALAQINNNTGAFRCIDYSGGIYLIGGEYGLLTTYQNGNFTVLQPFGQSGLFAAHWWDVDIKSSTEMFVVGYDWVNDGPLAYRTIRQGTRWANMIPGNIVGGVQSIGAVHFLDVDNGWIGSSRQYLALTNDNGVNWTNFKSGSTPSATPMTGLDMVTSVLGWACGGTEGGNDAYIIKFVGAPPKADISTSDIQVDFGSISCEKYVDAELFLRNSGTGDLNIGLGDITFSSPEFSIVNTQDFPLSIRPRRSVGVTVRWTPQRTFSGSLTAGMNINSNDPDHIPWQVELRGQRSHGVLDLLPEYAVSFGTCLKDTIYYDMPVYTAGNIIPTFIKYEFVSGHNDYSVVSPPAGTTVKDYANFRVRFAPQDSAMRAGVYRFIHGDPSCPDTTLVTFSGLGQLSVVQASVDTVDFGQICAGQVKDTTITLTNKGNTFASVGILEQVSGDPLFSSPDYSVFLLQDSSKTYRLRFAPTGAGTFTGTYRALYGQCTDTLRFVFRGEGLETKLEFDPKSPVRIGPIFANRTTAKSITISNTGTTPAHITNIRFSKILAPLQFSSKPNLPMTLAPGQATSVTVRFSPTKVGDYNTSIVVDWDARCADTAAVDINAICVPNPEIEAPTSADLGIQRCPAPLRDTIMIRNKGNGPLVFYSASVSGPDFQDFKIIQPAINDTAKAGSSYPMIVEFSRPTAGRSSAILRLTHNDYEAGRTDINVTAERTVSEYVVEGDSATAFFTRLFVPETRQFTIRNISAQPVTVTDVRVVKAASVFGVTPGQALPRTLAPNQSMQFEVAFTPNARGPFTGVIEVESDPCANIHALTLTGSGDTDGLSADRGDIDFTLDPCSFSSACEDIVLKNQSPDPVEVLSLSITQSGSAFRIDPAVATPFTLSSNAEKTVRICASPTVSGTETGTLIISSNDPAYPTLSVALRATRDSSGITVSESSIDFGRLADCMPAAPRRVTLLNTGDLRETVTFSFLNGGNGFSSTVSGPENIAAGRPLNFDISFTRPSYGTFDDVLIITVQRCGTEFRIPLHAEAVEQEYLAAPDPLVFPTVNVGGASNRQFTLQNRGGFDATITGVVIQPTGVFTLNGAVPTTVAAGSTENINLRFNPGTEGSFSASVCVIIAAPCPDTICISVEGDAVRGTLDVHPALLAFGSKSQCESGVLYDTLINSGSGPITILSATITGTGAAAFINQTPVATPEVVSAGGMRIFQILYDGSLAPGDGPVTAALTIRTDDSVLPQFDIPLEAERVTLRADAGGSVDFGPVQVGNPEVRTITLRNTGSTPLCYTTASFPAQVTVVPAPPFCINPGESQDLTLTFTATAQGLFTGTLALQVDAPCEDSTIYTLRARAEQGTLTQVDTIDLGVDAWCIPSSAQFSIASTYLEAVTLESVGLEGPDAAFFTIITPDAATLPLQIASGGSQSVLIDFAGEQLTRDYTATFVSRFTAFGSPVERRTVLRARRVVPTLSIGSASFPVTVLGQSGGTQSVTITNTSELPVSVSAVTLQLPDFIIRSLTPTAPAVLPPGGTLTAVIEFVPSAVGQFTDSLVARSDQPCLFQVSGLLTGEGIPQPIVNAILTVGSIQAKQDAIIEIPILTDSDLGPAGVTGWSGSISFNRSMLWPMEMVTEGSLSASMQVGFTYDNANGTVDITATGGTVSAGTGALAWLRCRVLIGNALTTPLRMSSDFGFTSGYASVAGRVDGSFELLDYCMPGDRLLNVDGGLLLRQNTPNPVELSRRGTTQISYTLPRDATVTLEVFDMIGRRVRHLDQGARPKGTHTLLLDVSDLRQGAYMYVLRTSTGSAVRRMVVTP